MRCPHCGKEIVKPVKAQPDKDFERRRNERLFADLRDVIDEFLK